MSANLLPSGTKLWLESEQETMTSKAMAGLTALIISWTFPPEAEVGALRVARFCRYLPEFGVAPIVLTVDENFYRKHDRSTRAPEHVRVERTSVLTTPLNLYARWKSRVHPSAPPAPRAKPGFFKRQLLTALQTPDREWGWYFPAVRAAEKLIREEQVDAIFSTAPPWTGHLIARRLKRKYNLPWLADFRDPWACSDHRTELPGWRLRLDRSLMASCLQSADRVICNTSRLRGRMLDSYPHLDPAKFVPITNGFDDQTARLPQPRSDGKRLLLHLGSLYRGRRIETFCQSLANLVQTQRLDPDSVKVVFLGDMDPQILQVVQQSVPELVGRQVVEFRPRVEWAKGQQLLASADVLLLFFDEELAVPAKFYEYLLTGKPILAVAKAGALTDILKSTNSGLWANPEDPADISAKLLQALGMPTRSKQEIEHAASPYHARVLSAQLVNLMREVAAGEQAPSHDPLQAIGPV